jgi:hypothetical protein
MSGSWLSIPSKQGRKFLPLAHIICNIEENELMFLELQQIVRVAEEWPIAVKTHNIAQT